MTRKINRAQLLSVTGWSPTDLDNRAHANQLALAHGLTLPAATGEYIGLDAVALLLSDALVEAGLGRTAAAQAVLTCHKGWLRALERLEWLDMHPPPVPTPWALTPRGVDEGVPVRSPDSEIYLAVAAWRDGNSQTASGSLAEIVGQLSQLISAAPAGAPTLITTVGLKPVYEATLAAAAKADVDLGVPFTRPVGHPEYSQWYAAVEVHRALSIQREKVRRPPGPRASRAMTIGRVKATAKAKRRAAGTPRGRRQYRAPKSATLTAE